MNIPKVMIIDDEDNVREVVNMIARYYNFDVISEISNSEEAVNIFRANKPDILFLDLNMPYKTGDEVLEEIKDEIQDVCVIMLTAFSDMENVKKCISLGAFYYIRKDTPIPQIIKTVGEIWDKFKVKVDNKTKKPNMQHILNEVREDNLLNNYLSEENKIG